MSGYKFFLAYGVGQTQIQLRNTAGALVERITLQKETTEGLELVFTPEGVARTLTAGSVAAPTAGYKKAWRSLGVRPSLDIKWAKAVTSSVEPWMGSAWGTLTTIDTAEAVRRVLRRAMLWPCTVYPHLDHAFNFDAQPDLGADLKLVDLRGVVHQDLNLKLIGTKVVAVPDWVA